MSSNPSWMEEADSLPPPPSNPPPSSSAGSFPAPEGDTNTPTHFSSESTENEPPYKGLVKWSIIFGDIIMAVLMAATGAIGIQRLEGDASTDDSNTLFLGLYMVLFASILFFYEVLAIFPLEILESFMKNNFGFMFSVVGRGFYMIFISVVCFSITNPENMAIGVGVGVGIMGGIQMLVYVREPNYFAKPIDLSPKDIPQD